MIFDWLRLLSGGSGRPAKVPTTVFITHAKAGSTWLDRIFRDLFGRLVAPRGDSAAAATGHDLSKFVFPAGRIYSAMFLSREELEAHPELAHAGRFVVLRDARDTLVSHYFSLKVSHSLDDRGEIERQRTVLNTLSKEEGLLYCLKRMRKLSERQLAWWQSGELVYRYEDLLRNDVPLLTYLFVNKLRLPVSPSRVEEAVIANRFEARFGRRLGAVDVNSHGRQGAPGNWREHFTPAVAEKFVEIFGETLIAGGYEPNHRWVKNVEEPVEAA
jgi:lipopolysaccharide transport system ATP-binding protein